MKKLFFLAIATVAMVACGGNQTQNDECGADSCCVESECILTEISENLDAEAVAKLQEKLAQLQADSDMTAATKLVAAIEPLLAQKADSLVAAGVDLSALQATVATVKAQPAAANEAAQRAADAAKETVDGAVNAANEAATEAVNAAAEKANNAVNEAAASANNAVKDALKKAVQ